MTLTTQQITQRCRAHAWKWPLLIVTTVGATIGLTRLGVPSAGLLAALLAATVLALLSVAPKQVPRRIGLAAQGVLGVHLGTMVHRDACAELGRHWPIVVAVVLSTVAFSIVAGALLGLHREVSPLTGALALVAGGASGLISIARELGGDDRVVAVVQYMRVALITASMPVAVALLFHTNAHTPHAIAVRAHGLSPWYLSISLLALIVVVGAATGQFIRLPAAGLLGPLVISIVLNLTGLAAGLAIPHLFVQVSYVLIGWQAGVGFTRESLQTVKRVLPTALGLIVLINIASGGLGMLLAHFTGLSGLDAYLATSPGGINAVFATTQVGSNVTLIIAMQTIRMLLMLFLAPLIAQMFIALSRKRCSVAAPL